jgi:hypothetical protein
VQILVRHAYKHSFPEIHEANLRTLTERHVITFRKQLINLLYQPACAILVKLREINMTPSYFLCWSICLAYHDMSFFISYPLTAFAHISSIEPIGSQADIMTSDWKRVWYEKCHVLIYIYHILVDNIANILPCNKTLNFA